MADPQWYDSGAGLYRQEELFKMRWPDDIGLQNHTIAAAPFGGPIALLRDADKIYILRSDEETEAYLTIYTASGVLMRRHKWDYQASMIGMAWISLGALACVLQNGVALIFSLADEAPVEVPLQLPRGQQVAACEFSGHSLVFRTTSTNELFAVADIGTPAPEVRPLASLRTPPSVSITAMTCRSNAVKDATTGGARAKSTLPEAIVALSDGTLFAVAEDLVEEMPLQSSLPVVLMALPANEDTLACFSKQGQLHVFDVVSKTCLYVIDTTVQKPPDQLIWCGLRALVLQWATLGTFFVSVAKQTVTRLEFRPPGTYRYVHLVEEIDSTRVIAEGWSDVLEPVHPGLVEARRPGSTAPVTLLYDARDAFDHGDADAESNMQQLLADGTLDDAVQQCCLVAAAEFAPESQKAFLRAASYGKSFCKNDSAGYAGQLTDAFRLAHNKLRILNNLRDPAVGIPLTSAQYDRLTPAIIVQRLCACRQHFLAAKVCKLLGMSNATVLSHWAYMKIAMSRQHAPPPRTGDPDRDLCGAIVRVFEANHSAVSYASVARQAYELGKRDLAIMLLHHETKVDEKVGLLLAMDDFGRALQVAVRSQNSDHVFAVLMPMRKHRPDGSLFTKEILAAYPDAADLLVLFLEQQQRLHAGDGDGSSAHDRRLLHRIYAEMSDSVRAGCCRLREANATTDLDAKLAMLNEATKKHFDAAAQASRDDKFFADAARMQVRLLRKQRELVHSSTFKQRSKRLLSHSVAGGHGNGNGSHDGGGGVATVVQNFVGLSLAETIRTCIIMDMTDVASQLQREFKVPDKRYWSLVVSALGKIGDWNGLWKFSNSQGKTPPIGFRPFALVCIEGQQPAQAAKYIARVKDDRQQIDLYLMIKGYKEAVQTALRRREHYDRLHDILRACNDFDQQQELRAIIHRAGLAI